MLKLVLRLKSNVDVALFIFIGNVQSATTVEMLMAAKVQFVGNSVAQQHNEMPMGRC